MSSSRRSSLAVLLLGLPTLAAAWYGAPPLPAPMGPPDVPYALAPPRGPAPGIAPGWGAMAPSNQPFMQQRMRISRRQTDQAYLVGIDVGDGKTAEVQVTPVGRGLVIARSSRVETTQQDRSPDGQVYQEGYRFAQGAMQRRVGLPPDADLSRLTRQEGEGRILLTIPRVSSPRPAN